MAELDPIDVEVGRRVREARNQSQLSQRALAARIGLTQQQVLKYESGHSRMAIATLCRIAEVLDVALSTFVDGLPDAAPRGIDMLTPPERELLAAYRSIPDARGRAALVEVIKSLSSAPGR